MTETPLTEPCDGTQRVVLGEKGEAFAPPGAGSEQKLPKTPQFRPSASREHHSGEHQVQRVSDQRVEQLD